MKVITFCFPGYYQLLKKKYFQGATIFILFTCSLLFILKILFFSPSALTKEIVIPILTTLLTSIIWHLFSLVFLKTQPSLNDVPFHELYEKGRLAFLKQNFELALIYFQKLYKISPEDEDVIYQLGKTYLELEQKKEARTLFKKYLSSGKPKRKWKKEIEDLYGEIAV